MTSIKQKVYTFIDDNVTIFSLRDFNLWQNVMRENKIIHKPLSAPRNKVELKKLSTLFDLDEIIDYYELIKGCHRYVEDNPSLAWLTSNHIIAPIPELPPELKDFLACENKLENAMLLYFVIINERTHDAFASKNRKTNDITSNHAKIFKYQTSYYTHIFLNYQVACWPIENDEAYNSWLNFTDEDLINGKQKLKHVLTI